MRGDGVRVTRASLHMAGCISAIEAVERRNEAGSSNWQMVIGITDAQGALIGRGSYLITPDAVFVERVMAATAASYQDLARPARMVLLPQFLCLAGSAIQQLAALGGDQPLPCLTPVSQPANAGERLLTMLVAERRAHLIGVEDLTLAVGTPARECLHYACEGELATDRVDYWIDDAGTVLRALRGERQDDLCD